MARAADFASVDVLSVPLSQARQVSFAGLGESSPVGFFKEVKSYRVADLNNKSDAGVTSHSAGPGHAAQPRAICSGRKASLAVSL